MDPDATMLAYLLARDAGATDDAAEALENLREWRAKGGFAPLAGWPAALDADA